MSMLTFASFASPSLSDASLTYSVRGYYSQYLITPSFTANTLIHDDGSITTTGSFRYTSDYFRVYPEGNFAVFYDNSILNDNLAVAFYDSSYNVVSGGFNWSTGHRVVDVPSDAYYARFTQRAAVSVPVLSSQTPFTVSNYSFLFAVIDNITIDADGHITIPYQTYAYRSVFLDFEFYSNNSFIDSFSLDVYSYLTGGFFDGRIINEYIDENSLTLYRYFNSGNDVVYEYIDESVSNPSSLSASFSESVEFRGFRLYIPVSFSGNVGSVSTSLHVDLSNFALNGLDAQARSSVDGALDSLSDLTDNLAVPLPTVNPNALINDALSGIDITSGVNFFTIFYDNELIPKMILIAVSFALLGYILFGKKEA